MAYEMTQRMFDALTTVGRSPQQWAALHHVTKRGLLARRWVETSSNGTAVVSAVGLAGMKRFEAILRKAPPPTATASR